MFSFFFLVTLLAIILRTSVEFLRYGYVKLKITNDKDKLSTVRPSVVCLKQPVISTCIVCRFFKLLLYNAIGHH